LTRNIRAIAQVYRENRRKREATVFSAKEVAASATVASFLLIGPALAQNFENYGSSSNAVGAQKVLVEAARDIHQLRSNPHFTNLLEKARGVFIVPELVKGALGFGGSGGTGVLVAHSNGHWGNPAFLTIGSFSFGFQAGGEAGPVFIFPMTDKALADFAEESHLFFYGSAGLTIATWRADARFPIGGNDVAVWSGENGAFAGLIVAGSDIHDKTTYDKAYYNNKYTEAKQIIGSRGDPNAGPLLSELPS
jgi:SH3 domain-containing YSC84-like protein 1